MDYISFNIVPKLRIANSTIASIVFIFIIFIPLSLSLSLLTRSLYTWQKMALLTVFFVTLFRSFDDKNDLDNEGDENNVKLNEWNDEENGVKSGLV